MGKRSRSDRKRAQQQRAIQKGDINALRALAERNAAAGANALRQLFADPDMDSEIDDRWLELAVSTSERLRAEGKPEIARALVSPLGGRTTALRVEEAICAFACGDDARVRALAAQDALVAKMVGPWLAAVDGKRVPNAPSGVSDSLRAVHQVCRAVSALVLERGPRARTVLSEISTSYRGKLFVTDFLAAAQVLSKGKGDSLERAALSLSRCRLLPSNPRLTAALAMAIARKAPRLFLDRLRGLMGLDEEASRDALLHASLSLSGNQEVQARVSHMIARLGADAFAPEHRANAALHEGFALALSDPERARVALDRALALGADMVESLRGRMLVASQLAARFPWHDARKRDALSSLSSSAAGLAKALLHDPAGGPLAAEALREAGDAAQATHQENRAREFVSSARRIAEEGGFLSDDFRSSLDVVEAGSYVLRDPDRAQQILEQVLTRSPRHHEAWHLKIDLVVERDAEAAKDLILQAAELKICDHVVKEAKQIKAERGLTLNPIPGQTTAGELAEELRTRVQARKSVLNASCQLDGDLAACRSQLSLKDQCALDVALVAILAVFEEVPAAIRYALQYLQGSPSTENSRQMLAAVACFFADSDLQAFAISLKQAGSIDSVVDLVKIQLSADNADSASRLLLNVASLLHDTQLRQLQLMMRAAKQGEEPAGMINSEAILDSVDAALAPDFCLNDLLAEDAGEDESDALTDDFGDDLLAELGLPASVVERMSPSDRIELSVALLEAADGGSIDRIVSVLERIGARYGLQLGIPGRARKGRK